MKNLWDLAGVFAYLSLLTVGGGMAAFPEMKELTVDTYHWVTFPELLHFYSLGSAGAGPEHDDGRVDRRHRRPYSRGRSSRSMAFFLPTGLLTFFVGRL